MDANGSQMDGTEPGDREPEMAEVRAHESRPGRVVFTEAGNTEAWIATDLAVEPDR